MAETDYRKSLQRLSRHLGLGRFLDWWLGELSAMVPSVLSGASKTTIERWVLVEISGSHVTFSRVAAGKIAEAGKSCLIVTFSLVYNLNSSYTYHFKIRSKRQRPLNFMRTVTHK
jgi:hypothetical protein